MRVRIAQDLKLEHGNLQLPGWLFEPSRNRWDWLFDYLVVVDVETTGLIDYSADPILMPELLEIAVAVLDRGLKICGETAAVIAYTGDPAPFIRNMHTTSGLLAECRTGVSLLEAEERVLALLREFTGKRPLVWTGFSPGRLDRPMLERYMPRIPKLMHYRQIDVSSLKLFMKNFVGVDVDSDERTHRAGPDIHGAIEMLRTYCALMSGGVTGVISMARFLEAEQELKVRHNRIEEREPLTADAVTAS